MSKLYQALFFLPIAIAPLFALSALAQQSVSSLEALESTFEIQRRPREDGIRRGAICVISPATDRLQREAVIWSDRPLFLWQNDSSAVQVLSLQIYNPSTNEIIWERLLSLDDQQVFYEGTPLIAGQTYVWELKFQRQNPDTETWEPETLSYVFQILADNRRDQITTELQQYANSSLPSSPDLVATNQANYLMQQGLLSDGLQVLYAIESPSPQLTATLEALTRSVCNP
jgi:hypothetical protein